MFASLILKEKVYVNYIVSKPLRYC